MTDRPGTVVVGRSVASNLAALRRYAWTLAGVGAVVLAAGLVGGGWLIARSLRPLRDISAAAEQIAGGELSRRINTTDTDNELDRLAGVLNSTFARLEAAFAQQARFTADAAHELRTPVTVMLTHTQSAMDTACPSEEHREAFAACLRAAQRMRRLTESLLQLARLDAGREPFHREHFDLAEAAADCIGLVRPMAESRRITIHRATEPVRLDGDPDRIGQIITNLLANAIHHNREGGEIRVATRAGNGTAILTVADTGPGIPPDHLPHIFERFYRADKARTAGSERAGLGLAISKAIVEAHGGRIAATSSPGEGATFTVELPLK